MKFCIKHLFFQPLLVGLLLAGQASAQTFTTLHSFAAGAYNPSGFLINSDGAESNGGLVLSDKTLYGTAGQGGSFANGTVFALNTDSTGFTNLHNFTALNRFYNTNSDGASPSVGLILSGNTLYGTTIAGGSSGNGTVFAISTNGAGLTTLHSFAVVGNGLTNSDGADPRGLILSGNTLYGITSWAALMRVALCSRLALMGQVL